MNNFNLTITFGIITASVIFSLDPIFNSKKHEITLISKNPKKTEAHDVKNTSKPVLKNVNDTLVELTALISGDTSKKYHVFPNFSTQQDYININQSFMKSWETLELKTLKKVSTFSSAHIQKTTQADKVFYPFSGPDILFAHHFFNSAKSYFLIGLEPSGTLPDFLKKQNPSYSEFKSYLRQLHNSMQEITHYSFFRTIDMSSELKNSYVDGTLHVILFFLGKMNCTPINIKNFEINGNGSLVYKNSGSKGVEVSFLNAKRDTCIVRYLSANIENSGFNNSSGVFKFLSDFKQDVTYIKGASYLLHNDNFSNLRNFILENSKTILQDDTGIPFRNYNSSWKLNLFGMYSKPISLFSFRFQKDLDSLYKNSKPLPLGFGLGYNFKDQNSALILAEKIKH